MYYTNQSVESAGVAFVKGANRRIKKFDEQAQGRTD